MEQSSLRIIYRHQEPTSLDTAEYLTICEVGSSEVEYYVQTSKDVENPKWTYLGKPSEDSFKYLINLMK